MEGSARWSGRSRRAAELSKIPFPGVKGHPFPTQWAPGKVTNDPVWFVLLGRMRPLGVIDRMAEPTNQLAAWLARLRLPIDEMISAASWPDARSRA